MLAKLSAKLNTIGTDNQIEPHTLGNFGSKLKLRKNPEDEVLSDHISKYISESAAVEFRAFNCYWAIEDRRLVNSCEIPSESSKYLMGAFPITAE